jgi:hypothetical protein
VVPLVVRPSLRLLRRFRTTKPALVSFDPRQYGNKSPVIAVSPAEHMVGAVKPFLEQIHVSPKQRAKLPQIVMRQTKALQRSVERDNRPIRWSHRGQQRMEFMKTALVFASLPQNTQLFFDNFMRICKGCYSLAAAAVLDASDIMPRFTSIKLVAQALACAFRWRSVAATL